MQVMGRRGEGGGFIATGQAIKALVFASDTAHLQQSVPPPPPLRPALAVTPLFYPKNAALF